MKISVIPNCFKGGMTSKEFCEIAKSTLSEKHVIEVAPMSDGGDGFLDCMFDRENIFSCKCADANFFKRNSRYAISGDDGFCGISECAPIAGTMIKDPMFTTSYGLGEVIKILLKLRKKRIFVSLGGSATNDVGMGILCALGGKFFNENGESFVPVSSNLNEIKSYDLAEFYENISGAEFYAVCDVNNPLTGKRGCTFAFAKQKGAREEDLEVMETNVRYLETLFGEKGTRPGDGAAGGIGYCIRKFFNGKILSGSEFACEKYSVESMIKDSDAVITGEGKFDETSLEGKITGFITFLAKKYEKKLYVFCGERGNFDGKIYGEIVEINDKNLSLRENIALSKERLAEKLRELFLGN